MANTLKFGNGEWYGKEGTILAYNDLNSNYKPLPFNFSRDSSATVVNKDGLIETVGSGQPRIDYKDDSKGALLLEPSRSNNVDNSTNFFLNSWSGTRVLEGSTIVSPNGQDEAHKLIATSVDNTHYREYTISSASSGSYTGSCFFKKGEFNVGAIRMGVDSSANRYAIYIDLNDGTFLRDATVGSPTGTSYKIKNYGNGWYRLSVTITHTSGEVRMSLSNASSDYTNSNGLPLFLGNSSDGGYAWGAQLEQGSYPTSYIPTQGSAVTRLRDLSDTQNLSHVIGQTEGVIFYDAILVHKSTDASEDLFELSIDDGSNQNIFFINNYNNTLTVAMVNGGSYQFSNNSFNPTEGARYKLAFAYKQNDFALYINGNQIATDSSGTVTTMNQITFGNYYNNQINLSNSVKVNNLKLYNTRLSNSELQALTS